MEYQLESNITNVKEVRTWFINTTIRPGFNALGLHSAENYADKALGTKGAEDTSPHIDVYVPMNRAMWRSLKGRNHAWGTVETRFAKLFDHFGFERRKGTRGRVRAILDSRANVWSGAEWVASSTTERWIRLYAPQNGITTRFKKGRLFELPIAKYFKKVFISGEVGAQSCKAFFERVASAIPDYDGR